MGWWRDLRIWTWRWKVNPRPVLANASNPLSSQDSIPVHYSPKLKLFSPGLADVHHYDVSIDFQRGVSARVEFWSDEECSHDLRFGRG
jgi:hypothetical protein